MNNNKRGFWAKEPERHYCSVCGAPAPVDANGIEDIPNICQNCHAELLKESDGCVGNKIQSFTIKCDTARIQDTIVREVQHQIQQMSEQQYNESIRKAVNDRCSEIQADAVAYLNENKRDVIVELTQRCIERKFEATVTNILQSCIKSLAKDILKEKEEEIRKRIEASFSSTFGGCR